MKRIVFYSVLFALVLVIISCRKDKDTDDTANLPFKFDSVYADPDTFAPMGQTQIYAVATGTNLTYTWTATLGNIVGNSSTVSFIATPCMIPGQYNVSCKVNDSDGNEQTKICNFLIQ